MPRTPDRFPGEREEEVIKLEPTSEPAAPGEIRFNGTSFTLNDGQGEYDPRTSGLSSVILTVAGTFVYTGDGDFTLKV